MNKARQRFPELDYIADEIAGLITSKTQDPRLIWRSTDPGLVRVKMDVIFPMIDLYRSYISGKRQWLQDAIIRRTNSEHTIGNRWFNLGCYWWRECKPENEVVWSADTQEWIKATRKDD
jgi:hypothetical protein